jgi:hypothetical protein
MSTPPDILQTSMRLVVCLVVRYVKAHSPQGAGFIFNYAYTGDCSELQTEREATLS